MALTKEDAHKIFRYENGILYWRIKPSNNVNAGDVAVKIGGGGYRWIGYSKVRYPAHRLVWIMHFGEIQKGYEIDHINHVRSDNRIENLRVVSRTGNRKNCSININNSSGVTGVYFTRGGKWHAQITVLGKKMHLGLFSCIEDAVKSRRAAEKMYGFHENHGNSQCL